jgi:hypothetical protein
VASYIKLVVCVHQRNQLGFKCNLSVLIVELERVLLRLAALLKFRHISVLHFVSSEVKLLGVIACWNLQEIIEKVRLSLAKYFKH